MNAIDIVLIIILLQRCMKGYKNGFMQEVTSSVALVVGIYAANRLSGALGTYIESYFSRAGEYTKWVAFAVIFIFVLILAKIVGGFCTGVAESLQMGELNKITGAMFGGLRRFVALSIIMLYGMKLNTTYRFVNTSRLKESFLVSPLIWTGNFLTSKINIG